MDLYNKSILLLSGGASPGNEITDFSPVGTTIEVHPDVALSDATAPEDLASSIYIPAGNNFAIQMPHTIGHLFSDNDWFIGGRVYIPVLAQGTRHFFWQRTTVASDHALSFAVLEDGSLVFQAGDPVTGGESGDVVTIISAPSVVPEAAFAHIAASRSGTTVRLFVNGQVVASGVLHGPLFESSVPVFVGAGYDGSAFRRQWFIADILVAIGTAGYTSNFTPPPSMVGTISGVTRDNHGTPTKRKVFAVPRQYPVQLVATESDDVTGYYELLVPKLEHTVVCLSDDDGSGLRNDLVSRVMPI